MRRLAQILTAAVWAAVALLCATEAGAHGGLSMDEDKCKLRVGPYTMHFVGYQPESPSGPREFCEDIPETGRTIVVLDYLNDELRDLPTEVRIVRDTGSQAKLDDITVLHLPPKRYASGSLNFEVNFQEPGKFVGLVTVGEQNKMVSRFPFSVGRSSSWLALAVAAPLVVIAAVVLYRFGMHRRNKATLAAR
ncbi:MAG TPA: hypothetical protein VMH32_16830 [Burkholderiales bacterium]|nr:hypothetical protein [Burkholderiales bacterium]